MTKNNQLDVTKRDLSNKRDQMSWEIYTKVMNH